MPAFPAVVALIIHVCGGQGHAEEVSLAPVPKFDDELAIFDVGGGLDAERPGAAPVAALDKIPHAETLTLCWRPRSARSEIRPVSGKRLSASFRISQNIACRHIRWRSQWMCRLSRSGSLDDGGGGGGGGGRRLGGGGFSPPFRIFGGSRLSVFKPLPRRCSLRPPPAQRPAFSANNGSRTNIWCFRLPETTGSRRAATTARRAPHSRRSSSQCRP